MSTNTRRIRVYAIDKSTNPARYYRLDLTRAQVMRVDNGALISCGLTAPDDVSSKWLRKYGQEVPEVEYSHSGCLSSCIMRGGAKCQW